ncbi:MAG: ATP-binding protein [Chloroflexi bacterium]|nr:ATP-binding protein [Chloroflexota bacterium]
MIESRLDQIASIRQWVSEHARANGFSDREISGLMLAVSEACANVVKHAYHSQPGNPVELDLIIDDAKLELRIRDYGEPFDLRSYQPPDLTQSHEGGYGVHIIRSLMDEVRYESAGERGTILTLVKRR